MDRRWIHFVDSLQQLVEGLCGMENGCVAVVQRFIRRDGRDESSIYGKSVSNQRIEALKSILGN